MSLTTDNVRPSPKPNAWRIGRLTIAGIFTGMAELVFCCIDLAIGKFAMGLEITVVRTLAIILIVFGNQATTYVIRRRQWLWSTRPSTWLVASSVADVAIASTLAGFGIFMAALPIPAVVGTLATSVGFAFVVDGAKRPVFERLGIA